MRKALVVLAVLAATSIGVAVAAAQSTPTTECRGTLSGHIEGDVLVPFAEDCVLRHAFVTGNVRTATQANSLRIERSAIKGGVDCFDCGRFDIVQSAVGGIGDIDEARRGIAICSSVFAERVDIGGNQLAVDVGNSATGCGGNVFTKTLALTLNFAPVTAERNVVGEDFLVRNNRRGVTLNRNVTARTLDCVNNNPAPTGSRNVAREKLNQCAEL